MRYDNRPDHPIAKAVKTALVTLIAIYACTAHAAVPDQETWTIEGKAYTSKGAAIRAVLGAGKTVTIQHMRCEVMTNKMTFKACPKNAGLFDNQPFNGLKSE